jgi:hypothetical protein
MFLYSSAEPHVVLKKGEGRLPPFRINYTNELILFQALYAQVNNSSNRCPTIYYFIGSEEWGT